MTRKTPPSGAPQPPAAPCEAGPGKSFDPTALPDDSPPDTARRTPREAPAPGTPLPDEEVDRLKSDPSPPPPPSVRGQPDRSAE